MKALASLRPSWIVDTVPPPGSERRRGALLLLQSSKERALALGGALESLANELVSAESADEVRRRVEDAAPDVLILDRSVAGWAALCRAFKAGPAFSMPIVVVDWAGGGEEAAVEALEAGADEYVGNASRSHELRARVHNQLRLKRRLDTLQRLRAERNSLRFDASLDSLTGVLNRNALDRALVRLSQECMDFSVLFLDVDFFKMINDTFGHGMGDHVLTTFGGLLKEHVRPNDVVGRFGGEEFVVVLRDARSETATRVAERIRQAVSGLTIDGLPRRVTVSAGVATRTPGESCPSLLARADAALYVAKRTGRNRVVVALPAASHEDGFISVPPVASVRPTRPSQLSLGHSAAE